MTGLPSTASSAAPIHAESRFRPIRPARRRDVEDSLEWLYGVAIDESYERGRRTKLNRDHKRHVSNHRCGRHQGTERPEEEESPNGDDVDYHDCEVMVLEHANYPCQKVVHWERAM